MKRKQTILNLILILVLCLSFINPLILPQPTIGAEEEEEDNFTTMPNYRWENQSTTDPAVQEQLIGDQYEVFNSNNETSASTQKFAKSRQLNSRDFYYESRFALDVGGNQTEYFRDVVGDACDFEEGDLEGFSGLASQTVSDGILVGTMAVGVDDRLSTTVSWSSIVYNTVKFRIKANVDDLIGHFRPDSIRHSNDFVLTTEWQVITLLREDTSAWTDNDRILTDFVLLFDENGGDGTLEATDKVWIDYIKFIGDLDYVTHVEDEIEDIWNWEDSTEYWYDVAGNVSDFEDGTTESYTSWYESTLSVDNGWLSIEDVGANGGFQVSGQTITAATYYWMTMEFWCNNTITQWVLYDSSMNLIHTDFTDMLSDTYYLISADITHGNWAGVESGYKIAFTSLNGNPFTVKLNMTYLYDVSLGDVEGYARQSGASLRYQYVNPLGYDSVLPDDDLNWIAWTEGGLAIDTELFTTAIIRIRGNEEGLRIAPVESTGATLGSYFAITTNFVEYSITFSSDSDWSGIETGFGLALSEVVGQGNFDGNERFDIDYILLLGHWSETDGFKFSLLNADDEEGMSFQFTGNSDNSYNLSIDMYDSVGVALEYTYSFDYSIDVDGWLRIRVEWHLDKRNAKVLLEYDNGSDILNIRRITDLYGSNLGFSRLLLLEEGFPSLCINNSIHAFAMSYVIIGYIDADWSIIEWREPDGSWTHEGSDNPLGGTYAQDLDSDFSSVSPYGLSIHKNKNVSTKSKWYRLTVDRFDGINFDYSAFHDGVDSDDTIIFVFMAYNVHTNGSLEPLFAFEYHLWAGPSFAYRYYIGTEKMITRYSVGTGGEKGQSSGSISMFYESSTKVTMQYKESDDVEDEQQGTFTYSAIDEEFSREMMFVVAYKAEKVEDGDADICEISIGGFSIKRKDIIGQIVGAILGPVITLAQQIVGAILMPLFLIFNIFALAIIGAFKELFAGLEPLFGILGDIFGVAIGVLSTAIRELMDSLEEVITGILAEIEDAFGIAISALWGLLWDAAGAFATFMMDVLAILFVVLLGLAQIIVELMMGILDWVWVNVLEASPLGFLIVIIVNVLVASPVIIMDIINLFLFWSFWILIGVWIIVLPMQAAQSECISDFLERVLGMLCFDCIPFEIAGFGLWFPLGIPLIFLTCAEIIVLV